MNRLEAFRKYRRGGILSKQLVREDTPGRFHTYFIHIQGERVIIQDGWMRDSYLIRNFTIKQAIAFIRRHFPIRTPYIIQRDPFKRVA